MDNYPSDVRGLNITSDQLLLVIKPSEKLLERDRDVLAVSFALPKSLIPRLNVTYARSGKIQREVLVQMCANWYVCQR